jgi:hypothetical protein
MKQQPRLTVFLARWPLKPSIFKRKQPSKKMTLTNRQSYNLAVVVIVVVVVVVIVTMNSGTMQWNRSSNISTIQVSTLQDMTLDGRRGFLSPQNLLEVLDDLEQHLSLTHHHHAHEFFYARGGVWQLVALLVSPLVHGNIHKNNNNNNNNMDEGGPRTRFWPFVQQQRRYWEPSPGLITMIVCKLETKQIPSSFLNHARNKHCRVPRRRRRRRRRQR